MFSTGTTISTSSGLRTPALTMVTGRGPARAATTEEPSDLLERTLGRRQPDALERSVADLFEPLEREREVGAALGRRDCMDLVDDHGFDAGEGVARRRCEHQVQRLGSRDQQIGRMADERRCGRGRRVARAHADDGLGERHLEALGGEPDARERRSEVLLDVERERAKRGQIQQTRAAGALGHRRGHEPVDAPQERSERLPTAGGCQDQRVLTGRDRPPPLGLRRRRLREGAGEPGPHRGREARQRGRGAARPGRSHPVEATALDPSSTRSR